MMEPDRVVEPTQECVLKMKCPKCRFRAIKWAVLNESRGAAESFPEEWWLQCANCGYEPDDNEYPRELEGVRVDE
jgi:hypothetical protein